MTLTTKEGHQALLDDYHDAEHKSLKQDVVKMGERLDELEKQVHELTKTHLLIQDYKNREQNIQKRQTSKQTSEQTEQNSSQKSKRENKMPDNNPKEPTTDGHLPFETSTVLVGIG